MATVPVISDGASPPSTAHRPAPNGIISDTPTTQTGKKPATTNKSHFTLNAAAFVPASAQPSYLQSQQATYPYGISNAGGDPNAQSFPSDGNASNMGPPTAGGSAILIRRLARSMSEKELRSMFLFAKDFLDSEFIAPPPEDAGFSCAIARFRTAAAAQEVQGMLDGKANTANEARMIVQSLQGARAGLLGHRRNTVDGMVGNMAHCGPSSSASSSASSNGPVPRQASRYNDHFQSLERRSPPMSSHGMSNGAAEFPTPDSNSHFQNLFSPQSPIGTHAYERPRVTGKSVINDDAFDDDETGELLKDPVAYAQNGHAGGPIAPPMPRRSTNSQSVPVSRFGGLSLSTTGVSPPGSGGSGPSFTSPRSAMPMPSPGSAMSPSMMGSAGSGGGQPNSYQLASPHLQRPNYPPANPADQNPPCNTLYVGNLPIDTNEDELKAMFSKQRGYKRLCFRTKQNGPMCFVEFEDVSFATKALNELYGHPLHNSVKGGIRLSFSKNPLGVRTGQQQQQQHQQHQQQQQHSPNGHGGPSLSNPHASMQSVNGAMGSMPGSAGGASNTSGGSGSGGQPFITANGPPPGLSMPPGLHSPNGISSSSGGSGGSGLGGLSSPLNGHFSSGAGFASLSNSGGGGGFASGGFRMSAPNGVVGDMRGPPIAAATAGGGGGGVGGIGMGGGGGFGPEYSGGR